MGDSECMDLTHSVHTFHPYLRGAHVVTKNRRLHYQTSPVDRRELQQCNTHSRTALPTTRETLPSVFLGYVSQTISLISERVHVFANRPQQRLTLLSARVARCTILIRESTIVRGFFSETATVASTKLNKDVALRYASQTSCIRSGETNIFSSRFVFRHEQTEVQIVQFLLSILSRCSCLAQRLVR